MDDAEDSGWIDMDDDGTIQALAARIPELDPWTLDEKRDGDRYTFQAATPTDDPDHAPAYSSPSLALLGIYDSIDLPLERAVKVHEIDGHLDLLNYESLVMGAVNGDTESKTALDRFAPEFEAKLYNVLCKDLFDHERSPSWYVRELTAVPLTKEAALRTLALRDNAVELGLLKETSNAANRSSRLR